MTEKLSGLLIDGDSTARKSLGPVDFEIPDTSDRVKITIVMVKLDIVFQAGGGYKTIYGLTNRKASTTTVTINTRRALKK